MPRLPQHENTPVAELAPADHVGRVERGAVTGLDADIDHRRDLVPGEARFDALRITDGVRRPDLEERRDAEIPREGIPVADRDLPALRDIDGDPVEQAHLAGDRRALDGTTRLNARQQRREQHDDTGHPGDRHAELAPHRERLDQPAAHLGIPDLARELHAQRSQLPLDDEEVYERHQEPAAPRSDHHDGSREQAEPLAREEHPPRDHQPPRDPPEHTPREHLVGHPHEGAEPLGQIVGRRPARGARVEVVHERGPDPPLRTAAGDPQHDERHRHHPAEAPPLLGRQAQQCREIGADQPDRDDRESRRDRCDLALELPTGGRLLDRRVSHRSSRAPSRRRAPCWPGWAWSGTRSRQARSPVLGPRWLPRW